MASRQVTFKVTAELLHNLLKLPADVRVTGFSEQVYFDSGAYALRCESDTFPETPEGYKLPEATPQYSMVHGRAVFEGWSGLPPADLTPPPMTPEQVAELRAALEKTHTGRTAAETAAFTVSDTPVVVAPPFPVDGDEPGLVRVDAPDGNGGYIVPNDPDMVRLAREAMSGEAPYVAIGSAPDARPSPFVVLAPRDEPDAPHVVGG